MKKIILSIFTVLLLTSCAMEDTSNNSSDSEIGARAAGVSAGIGFTSNENSDITSNSSYLFRKFIIDFGVVWSETQAAHLSGIYGPGLPDGSFGSSWSGN